MIQMSVEKNSLKSEHLLYLKLLWDLEGAEFGLELAVKQHVACHRQFSSPAYPGVVFPIGSHKLTSPSHMHSTWESLFILPIIFHAWGWATHLQHLLVSLCDSSVCIVLFYVAACR